MALDRDAYAVLQVDPRAEDDVVHAAYRALARRYHPDGRAPDPRRMAELNDAYDCLKHPDRRRAYDQSIASNLVGVGPGRPGGLMERRRAGLARTPFGDERDTVIDFGQYDGWRIADVAKVDPEYLRWLSRHSNGIRFARAIALCLPNDTQVGRP